MASQKSYDYDEVLDFLNTNGTVDSSLIDLQTHLVELEDMVNRMQDLFHGKPKKDIYKLYNNLYTTIGQNTAGAWGAVKNIVDLNNKMYSKAAYDKSVDEEADLQDYFANPN